MKRKSKTLRKIQQIEINYFSDPLNAERRQEEILDILFRIFVENRSPQKPSKQTVSDVKV